MNEEVRSFTIGTALFVGLFGWLLGRWRGMLAAFLGIALYAALAGASAGVVRAAAMRSWSRPLAGATC